MQIPRRAYIMLVLTVLSGCGEAGTRMEIVPTDGPLIAQHSPAIAANMTGEGSSGRVSFALPGGVTCEGPWNIVPGGALSNITGVGAYTRSNVASDTGTAVGTCSNRATFQFDFTVDPKTKRGEGTGKDSSGNVYKVTF